MGTRKQREKQEDIWIAHSELAAAPGHPFYQRLNELLEAERFDEFVEQGGAKVYAEKYGRAALPAGICFWGVRGACPAAGGRAGFAAFRGYRAGRVHAGSLDDFAHAAADRCGHASRSIQLGVGGAGGSWVV